LSDIELLKLEEIARKNSQVKIEQRRKQFEKNHPSPVSLSPGDLVYVKTHPLSNKEKNFSKKFAKVFDGPYVVHHNNGNNSYVLENLKTGNREDHHINNIKY